MNKKELYFRSFGQGKPLIILHGILGSSEQWISAAQQLASYRQVIIPDMPNHALSPHFPKMDFSFIAGIVFDFISAQKFHEISILGHSWGGKVAMKLVDEYPVKVEKLIVADISPKQYPLFTEHREWINAVKNLQVENYKSFGEISGDMEKFISDKRTVLLLLKNICRRNGILQWKSNMNKIVEDFDKVLKAVIPQNQINIPSLLLCGENSHYVTHEDFYEMEKIFPNLQLAIIPNAGHWLHAENPQVFIEKIADFLEK